MTKEEVFNKLHALTENIIKLVQLKQKKFLETGNKEWLYGPNIHMDKMQEEYDELIEKYKKLGGIVIGLKDIQDDSGEEWKNE